MTKVTLIRHVSGFCNVLDKFRIKQLDSQIDWLNERIEVYVLPDFYVIGENMMGDHQIYCPKGEAVEIVSDSSGRPRLVGAEAMPWQMLEPASIHEG